jgi:hypothetical protein
MESNSFYWLEESAQRLKVVQFRGAGALARVPKPFQLLRHLKIHATIIIHFGSGSKVELRERNFLRGLGA